MLASSSIANQLPESRSETPERLPSIPSAPVLACVDASTESRELILHAMTVASALGAPLTLLHVLSLPGQSDGPTDPVEWSIRMKEARSRIRRMAREGRSQALKPEVKIAEGRPVDQICRCARELEAGIIVVGTKTDQDAADWELGEVARQLIDRSQAVLLLIPPSANAVTDMRYRRILVPLDGSRTAESVLPLACRLARSAGAELLLAHIVPVPEMTEPGPLEAEDHELRQRVSERNERVARRYVEQIRSRHACSGVAVRSAVISNGDVRSALARLVADEAADLLVMSAHGRSCRPDVALGGVAGYMITHARTPLLLVKGSQVPQGNQLASSQLGGLMRRPLQ